ncbi:hypothetical protein ACOJBO_01685 [Rhizobium beringeri]
MAPIFLVDLDDTLFRSRRKLPGFTDGQLTLGARVLDPDAPASKHSYMTPTQKALVDWLLRTTQVIPVTARGTDSYANVQIPFSSYAIVANGAVILDPDGKPDAEWRDMVEAQLLPFADYFSELLDAARAKSADLRSFHALLARARGWRGDLPCFQGERQRRRIASPGNRACRRQGRLDPPPQRQQPGAHSTSHLKASRDKLPA